ncbi:MAG TPA: nucleotidyltransferase family protein [Candidatus Binatia bacterium]
MTTARYQTEAWPTREQELLLRAALLRGPDAVQAWNEWKSAVDIDRLDAGSYRLLPLLYKNLQQQGVQKPVLDKYKEVYRETWYKNRLLFRDMARLLGSFHDAGLPTLVLKGAPLVLLYYKDYGLRPMADFDVLVRTRDALRAFGLLKSLGWKPPPRYRESEIPIRHGTSFKNGARRQFDLHWHAIQECCAIDADDDFWRSAAPLRIDDAPTSTLNPADHLLQVCAHGVRWNIVPTFRWVADAIAIMNEAKSQLDWDRLLAQTRKRRLMWPMKEALGYLRERFDAPIPAPVLEAVQKIPAARTERFEYLCRSEYRRRKLLGQLPILWFNYRRLADGASQGESMNFLKYLQLAWRLDRPQQIALHAFLKSLRCVARVLPWIGARWAKMPALKR